MVLTCYKCGHLTEITEEELEDICLDKKPFICSNPKCDSWQFIEGNDLVEVNSERKLTCKKCGSTNFKPCGDGDGINLTLDQWECECGNSVWVYSKYDNEDIMKLKKERVTLRSDYIMKWEDALFGKANKNYKIKIGDKEIKTKVVKKYCCGVTTAYFDFMDDIEIEEIERKIDWNKVPAFTKIESKSKNGWIKQYYIGLNHGQFKHTHPFVTSSYDEFIHNGESYNNTCYEECRIHESVDIPEEWYKDE